MIANRTAGIKAVDNDFNLASSALAKDSGAARRTDFSRTRVTGTTKTGKLSRFCIVFSLIQLVVKRFQTDAKFLGCLRLATFVTL